MNHLSTVFLYQSLEERFEWLEEPLFTYLNMRIENYCQSNGSTCVASGRTSGLCKYHLIFTLGLTYLLIMRLKTRASIPYSLSIDLINDLLYDVFKHN